MAKITKGAKVECLKCQKQYDISIDDFVEPDIDYDDEERDMGIASNYTWQYKTKCKSCGNDISVTIYACEYPAGSIDDEDFGSEGCKIVENPKLEAQVF